MRTFRDSSGTEWQVWRVTPSAAVYPERRREARRAAGEGGPVDQDRRSTTDRRKGDIQLGWLCFDSEAERRRLYPVPPDWEDYPDEGLILLLKSSEPVARKNPRI